MLFIVTSCVVVDVCRRLRRSCCLHRQGRSGVRFTAQVGLSSDLAMIACDVVSSRTVATIATDNQK